MLICHKIQPTSQTHNFFYHLLVTLTNTQSAPHPLFDKHRCYNLARSRICGLSGLNAHFSDNKLVYPFRMTLLVGGFTWNYRLKIYRTMTTQFVLVNSKIFQLRCCGISAILDFIVFFFAVRRIHRDSVGEKRNIFTWSMWCHLFFKHIPISKLWQLKIEECFCCTPKV